MRKTATRGLERAPNGYWYVRTTVRAGGQSRQIRRSTGTQDRREALEVRDRWIAEVRAALLDPRPVAHTFDEAAVEYVESLVRRGKDPARAIQDLRQVDPYIGGLALAHVHQGALAGYFADSRGTRRSGTVARAVRTVTAVLNLAARVLRDGARPWLETAVPRITAPDWNDRLAAHRLSWDEQDRLLGELAAHLVRPVAFGLWTGAREHEIVALRHEWRVDVDGLPHQAVWWLPPAVTKGHARKSGSDQAGRYLVCNRAARALVGEGSGLVFPGPRGQLARLNQTGWRAAWRRAGLPLDGRCGPHNLRHTFAARLEAAGVPEWYRKALLGHTLADIAAVYAPPGLGRLLAEAEKVSRAVAILRPVLPNLRRA